MNFDQADYAKAIEVLRNQRNDALDKVVDLETALGKANQMILAYQSRVDELVKDLEEKSHKKLVDKSNKLNKELDN